MKKMWFLLVFFLSVLIFSTNVFSQPVPKRSVQLNETQITENLLVGTQSSNKGLCASSTYFLGELCCKKSVIPLLSILHNGKCEEIRILAALSLCKVGDARGIYAIKRAGIYDESDRVRRLCKKFYSAFLAGKVSVPSIPENG